MICFSSIERQLLTCVVVNESVCVSVMCWTLVCCGVSVDSGKTEHFGEGTHHAQNQVDLILIAQNGALV